MINVFYGKISDEAIELRSALSLESNLTVENQL